MHGSALIRQYANGICICASSPSVVGPKLLASVRQIRSRAWQSLGRTSSVLLFLDVSWQTLC